MISIVKLRSEHLQELKLLYEDAFENSRSDLTSMIKTFETLQDNPHYNIACAIIDNKVAGSVMGVICHDLFGDCSPFMVIENVAVFKEYRRHGVAKELMMHIEEFAVAHSCSLILLVSSEHRTGAHKLYESLGYGADKVNGYRKRLK